jgi:hypothetical protein
MASFVQMWKGSWGVLGLWGVSGQSRSDRFAKPVWPVTPACVRLSPIEAVWPVSETGLTGLGCQQPCRVCFRCVCCGCCLGLAPRFSSASVAAWTWQEKLAEVHEWNRVHRPNSWIEFLSAPIHSSSLLRRFGPSLFLLAIGDWLLGPLRLLSRFLFSPLHSPDNRLVEWPVRRGGRSPLFLLLTSGDGKVSSYGVAVRCSGVAVAVWWWWC